MLLNTRGNTMKFEAEADKNSTGLANEKCKQN